MFGKSASAFWKPMWRSVSAGWPARPRMYQTVPSPPRCSNSQRGAELGVEDLVVVQVVGALMGHEGVDRDGRDAGFFGLVEACVKRLGIVRVEDDRVDVGSDEVADVAELAGRVDVPRGIASSPRPGPMPAPRPWPCRPAPRGSRCRRRRRSSSRSWNSPVGSPEARRSARPTARRWDRRSESTWWQLGRRLSAPSLRHRRCTPRR